MMNIEKIKKADFSREADILKTIGHPVRLKIIVGLLESECCVKDIWECMELPQALVSQHLSILKSKGIVNAKREGNKMHYGVKDPFVKRILNNCIINEKQVLSGAIINE